MVVSDMAHGPCLDVSGQIQYSANLNKKAVLIYKRITFSCTKCICMNSRQCKKIAKLSVEGKKKKPWGKHNPVYSI